MSFAILGIGTAVPAAEVCQADAIRIARQICCRSDDQANVLTSLYGHTGIEHRHLAFGLDVLDDVLEGTRHSGSVFLPAASAEDRGPTTLARMEHYRAHAGPLALEAARAALADSKLEPAQLTHLVTVSCTGFHAPGVDVELIAGLGLKRGIERTNVGYMGCHGALNGLRVARAFTGSDRSSRVLLCAVELCGLHYHYAWNPKQLVANALFADGAAAVVGVAAEQAPAVGWRATGSGSTLFPSTESAMTWQIGDHGFEMGLSTRVPDLIGRNLRPWVEGWLEGFGLTCASVASWAVHPGGPRVLSAVEEALGLEQDELLDSREILRTHGNMSSPTLLFILRRLIARQAPRPCVALGFGPGLAVEAALFE